MARYRARLRRDADGTWIAAAVELPHCWSRGQSEAEALAKLRNEIRHRIEFCPCSGVDEEYVRVEVEEVGKTPATLTGMAGCPPPPDPPATRTSAPRRERDAGWRRWDD